MNSNDIEPVLRRIIRSQGKEILSCYIQLMGMLFDARVADWQIIHLDNALRTGEMQHVINKLPNEPEHQLSIQAAERIYKRTRTDGKEIVSWVLQAFGYDGVVTQKRLPKPNLSDTKKLNSSFRTSDKISDIGNSNRKGKKHNYRKNVTNDYVQPIEQYRKAAEKGLAWAQTHLGWMYGEGNGASQDYDEAIKWYRKAAEQGDSMALNNLGHMYQNGYGVTQDYTEAIKWYRKAIEKGNPLALTNLGWMYKNGFGVSQDYAEAVMWYRKAAEQGRAIPQNNLGWMYENGYGVSQDYTEAIKWFRKAIKQGNAMAQNNMGHMYEKGNGVSQDYDEAIKWYRKAAEQNNATAQYNLGWMYHNGYGVTQDYEEAIKWYRKAIEQGNEQAPSSLKSIQDQWRVKGLCYYCGGKLTLLRKNCKICGQKSWISHF